MRQVVKILELLEEKDLLKPAVLAGVVTPFSFNYYQTAKIYQRFRKIEGKPSGEAARLTAEQTGQKLRAVYRALNFCHVLDKDS